MSAILVIGSSNTDMVVKTDSFPTPGETVLGGQFFMFPGGKGANQAVAASRLLIPKIRGQHHHCILFITKLGIDIFGEHLLDGFQKAGIDTRYVIRDSSNPSGVALITVNDIGENHIVVAPGANKTLSPKDLDVAEPAFRETKWLLMQLEIPINTIISAAEKASTMGIKIILNPAPAQTLPDELFTKLYLITPNETEAGFYSGVDVHDIDSARKAANILLSKGVLNVVITMGAKGAFFKNSEEELLVGSPEVKAVDTTAAGDIFNGALSVALSESKPWKEALDWACKAAAISVTRMGAQSSAPYRGELVEG